jgi:hypothetical protein
MKMKASSHTEFVPGSNRFLRSVQDAVSLLNVIKDGIKSPVQGLLPNMSVKGFIVPEINSECEQARRPNP